MTKLCSNLCVPLVLAACLAATEGVVAAQGIGPRDRVDGYDGPYAGDWYDPLGRIDGNDYEYDETYGYRARAYGEGFYEYDEDYYDIDGALVAPEAVRWYEADRLYTDGWYDETSPFNRWYRGL